MIFYFTGTGNSYHAAKRIAELNGDCMISISGEMKKSGCLEYQLAEGEMIGFVYPVYAWAPPKMVLDFIKRLQFDNFKGNYIFSIATCGDNVGNTMKVLHRSLNSKGLNLNSGFSIVMPNNYILLGNIDSKKVEDEKLSKAEERLKEISSILKSRKKGVFDLKKGPSPFLMTGVINPLFSKYSMNTKRFYATNTCTSCGLCEKVCTTGNISVDKKPSWGKDCTQCLACIHLCPAKAIQYGKVTLKKGRYKNPNIASV